MTNVMKARNDRIEKLEDAFKAIHGREGPVSISPDWDARVMRAVRWQARQAVGKLFDFEVLSNLVWRFAGATCLVALLLTAYSMVVDPGMPTEVARAFFEDPLAMDLASFLEAV